MKPYEFLDDEEDIEESNDDIITFEAPVSILDDDFDNFEEEIYEEEEHQHTEWDNIQL